MSAHINLQEEARFTSPSMGELQSRYKLLNNLDKVTEWLTTDETIPVIVNMTLTNRCTHRCALCTSQGLLDNRTMPTERALEIIREVCNLGAKAVGFGGGGDPTCHPDLARVINYSGELGLEVAMTTNGQLLTPEIIAAVVKYCTWIRVSLDADTPATYKRVHGMDEVAFGQVVANLRALTAEKRRTGSEITIGTSYLLGPHTLEGAYGATKLARECSADYMRLRPFFNWEQHLETKLEAPVQLPKRRNSSRQYAVPRHTKESFPDAMMQELRRCNELATVSYGVSYPKDRSEAICGTNLRVHKRCYVHHFETVIAADLKVYPCCFLEDNARYCYGSVASSSFRDVWSSPERVAAYSRIDFRDCPNPCSLEKHNELLWEIKHNEIRPDTKLGDMIAAVTTKMPHANFL